MNIPERGMNNEVNRKKVKEGRLKKIKYRQRLFRSQTTTHSPFLNKSNIILKNIQMFIKNNNIMLQDTVNYIKKIIDSIDTEQCHLKRIEYDTII